MGNFNLSLLTAAMDHARIAGPTNLQREMQEMYNTLTGERNEDIRQVSLAANGSSDLVKSLQPVSLDIDRLADYEAFFYGRRLSKQPKATGEDGNEDDNEDMDSARFVSMKRKRSFLVELFDQSADIANALNCFFMFMRDMVYDGRSLFAIESNRPAWEARISDLAMRAYRMRDTLRNGDKSSVTESMYSLLQAMMQGDKHTIRPSTVYSKGLDVVLARSARDNALMCSNIQYGSFLPPNVDDYGYESDRKQAFLTETSLKVKDAARQILDYLFGAGNEHSSFEPNLKILPLTTDFVECQRIFEKTVGISLPVDFFNNITFGADGKSRAESFARVCLVLHAEKEASKTLDSQWLTQRRSTGIQPTDLLSAETIVKHNVQKTVTEEAALLNRIVGATIAFTFDEATARYISQTEASEELNISNFDNWFSLWSSQFLRKPNARVKNSLTGGRIKLANIPRYVLPVSKLGQVTEARQKAGLSVEETRANEDGLYVTPTGTLSYLPSTEQRSKLKVIDEFERLSASVSNTCAQYGINASLLSEEYYKLVPYGMPYEVYQTAHADLEKLSQYDNSLLSYDWDYGLRVYASGRPGIVRCVVEVGAVKPDDLTIADYLGFNMAKEGQAPLQKSFADSLMLMTHDDPIGQDKNPKDIYGSPTAPTLFVKHSNFTNIIDTYLFHAYKGELPKLSELAARTMKELNINGLEPDTPRGQATLYKGLVNANGTLRMVDKGVETDRELIRNLLEAAVSACSGRPSSWVHRAVTEDLGAGADYQTIQEEIENHEDYFMADRSPAHHFARVYNFIGGNIFKQILDAVNSLTVEQLTTGDIQAEYTIRLSGDEATPGPEVRKKMKRPDSAVVLDQVKPIALIFGKYAQNYDTYEARAEEGVKSIGKDEGLDVDDINVPGATGLSMFPHQVDTHRYLRKEQPPKFAVFDISPGGGKTLLGLTDIAALAGEVAKLGKRIKPLVLCPDGLIRNWCDDMKAFTKGNWNMIPIDSAVFKRWGSEKLQRVIETAPPNTIVVAGLNFLRNNKLSIVIGNAVVNVGTNLEFIKALKFNYIVIDESHKLKGKTTSKHQITKQLTTASFVDYLRIATGTLIADRVKDIEGQTALYSPHIFRQGELANTTVSQALEENLKLGDDEVDLWKVGTPQRARERLGKFAAVITKKKKEWAFMLPNPIETFHAINFVNGESQDEEELRQGELHRQLYDTVVQESIEALEELLSKATKKKKSSEDDDDEEDDDADGDDVGERSTDFEMDENDQLSGISADALDAYLQRIERLIIAPEKDPLFDTVFGAYGIKKYTSRKAKVIAEIVDKHFNPEIWDKGKVYKEYSLVKHKDALYLARKSDLSESKALDLPRDTIGKDPSTNPELWKKEPEGKVIIFCRYTNSVGAVYDALPAKYKAMAVRFTGQEVDKWSNLDAFKSDPKVKILIANEMGMSEGHNLQMASRMIRVESPWGPGELDQSASRIFRPDPKGAAAGDIYREAVFLDWVLADHTMEVAKQGRLIAKIFNKTRFDEAENPKYAETLSKFMLPEVSMSLAVLQERPSLHDYSDYVRAYAALNGLQRAEFHDMRVNQPSSMLPVPDTKPLEGSTTILTPYISSQDIPDPNGWKPISVKQYLRSEDGAPFREDPNGLVGKPVMTDLGYGMIVSVRVRYKAGADGTKKSKVIDTDRPVSSVQVKLKGSDAIENFGDTGLVYLPTKITSAAIKNQFAVDLAYRKADLKRQEQAIRDQERLEEQEEKERIKRERREQRQGNVRVRTVQAGETRERNIREGKPVNLGVTYEPNSPVLTGVRPQVAPTVEPIMFSPAYYHGYLTLETDDIAQAKTLKRFNFKEVGEYAFITVKRKDQLNALLDYIEDNFHLNNKTVERLGAVFKAFGTGKRGLYNLELAPIRELPHFFSLRKQMVKNKQEARIFPFFMDDKLMLAVDVATSPVIKKHIGKAVPSAASKWQLSPGALMYFAENKTDLNAKIKELKAAGIPIASPDVLKKEVAEIKFRAARNK